MMTQKDFDNFIKESRTVSRKIYNENKALFGEVEQQGRIRIKNDSSQITVGNTMSLFLRLIESIQLINERID